jgi:hypothetical protein
MGFQKHAAHPIPDRTADRSPEPIEISGLTAIW